MLNSRQILSAHYLANYSFAQRSDIQAACGSDVDGRTMRRDLEGLCIQQLIHKTRAEVVYGDLNGHAPVYFLSALGAEFLYAETKNEWYLSRARYTPRWETLPHTLAVARFHRLLDLACETTPGLQLESFTAEWDVADHEASEPHKRYKTFTLIRENPRLVCRPDAAFVLTYTNSKGSYKQGYYLELDRATTAVRKLAASKTGGYAEMAIRKMHGRHFPGLENVPFRVLMVTQSEGRRDLLAKAIKTKAGAGLWWFISAVKRPMIEQTSPINLEAPRSAPQIPLPAELMQLTPEKLFMDWDVVDCEGNVRTMIKKPETKAEAKPEADDAA